MSSPGPSLASGALSLSSFTHLPKGVESYFVLQVNFKAQSVFKKVLQDPRQHDSSQLPLNFSLCYRALFTRRALQGEIQAPHVQACCLEYKCEWWADCLLPNWKCSVGVYWHGIIPRKKKKKKKRKKEKKKERKGAGEREKLDCTFFF